MLPGTDSTAIKGRYLKGADRAGFKSIDAVSFVSPKAVSADGDSENVLSELDPPDDVEIIGSGQRTGRGACHRDRFVGTVAFPIRYRRPS